MALPESGAAALQPPDSYAYALLYAPIDYLPVKPNVMALYSSEGQKLSGEQQTCDAFLILNDCKLKAEVDGFFVQLRFILFLLYVSTSVCLNEHDTDYRAIKILNILWCYRTAQEFGHK